MPSTLENLVVTEGSKREHFRRGQGRGTGNGKTAGKGQKGQGAHAHTKKGYFEGGQMPLIRRIPKFGFKNISRKEYAVVDLGKLNAFKDGETVTVTKLIEKGIVKKTLSGVKILSGGTLEKKVNVQVHAISKSAKVAIETLGGTVEVIK